MHYASAQIRKETHNNNTNHQTPPPTLQEKAQLVRQIAGAAIDEGVQDRHGRLPFPQEDTRESNAPGRRTDRTREEVPLNWEDRITIQRGGSKDDPNSRYRHRAPQARKALQTVSQRGGLSRLGHTESPKGDRLALRERPSSPSGPDGPIKAKFVKSSSGLWHSNDPYITTDSAGLAVMSHHLPGNLYRSNNRLLFSKPPFAARPSLASGTSVPLAYEHSWHGSPSFETDSVDENGRAMKVLTSHQLLDDLLISDGPGGFTRAMSFPCNPATFGSRAASLALSFDFFKFKKLQVHFVPSLNTSTSGQVVVFYSSDNHYPVTMIGRSAEMIASTLASYAMSSIWAECNLTCDLSDTLPMYSTSLGASNLSTFQGAIHFGAVDTIPGTFAIGQAFLTFEIEFRQPSLSPLVALSKHTSVLLDWGTSAGPSVGQAGWPVTFWLKSPALNSPSISVLGGSSTDGAILIGCLRMRGDVVGTLTSGSCSNWIDPTHDGGIAALDAGVTFYVRSFVVTNVSGSYYAGLFLFSTLAQAETASPVDIPQVGFTVPSCTGCMTYGSAWVAPAVINRVTCTAELIWYPSSTPLS